MYLCSNGAAIEGVGIRFTRRPEIESHRGEEDESKFRYMRTEFFNIKRLRNIYQKPTQSTPKSQDRTLKSESVALAANKSSSTSPSMHRMNITPGLMAFHRLLG